MRVTIELDTGTADDLKALLALTTALGGVPQAPDRIVSDLTWAELNQGRKGPPIPDDESLPPAFGDMIEGDGAGEASLDAPVSDVPPPPAPTDDAGPATLPNPVPERDVNGRPWNADVHASTKAVNADGSWRYKRGADEAAKKAFEAQYPAVPAGDVPPPPAPADVPVGEALQAALAAETPPPPPPADDVPSPPVTLSPLSQFPTPAAATGSQPFVDFMRRANVKRDALGLTGEKWTAKFTGIAQTAGLTGIADIMKNQDKIPMLDALLEAMTA